MTHHHRRVAVAEHIEPDVLQLLPEVIAVLSQLGQLTRAAAGAVRVLDELQRRDDLLRGRRRHGARVQLRRPGDPQALYHAPAGHSTRAGENSVWDENGNFGLRQGWLRREDTPWLTNGFGVEFGLAGQICAGFKIELMTCPEAQALPGYPTERLTSVLA